MANLIISYILTKTMFNNLEKVTHCQREQIKSQALRIATYICSNLEISVLDHNHQQWARKIILLV